MQFIVAASWWDNIVNFFSSDPKKAEDTVHALERFSNWLHPQDMFSHLVNQAVWGIIKLFYGLAKFASEITNGAFEAADILDEKSTIFGMQANYIKYVVGALMLVTLSVIAIQMVVSKQPPQIKNVFVQLIVAAFIVTNIGGITRQISNLAQDGYHAAVGQEKGEESSIPFKIVKANTNDTLYLLKSDFKGVKDGSDETFGHNQIDQEDFDSGRLDMSMDLTPKLLDTLKDTPGYNNNTRIKPDDLQMRLTSMIDDNGQNKNVAAKIDGTNFAWHKFYSGGYKRFPVATVPTLIGLLAVTVAFLFGAFVIIKSFLDLAIMQIIGILVVPTDLSVGNRTKKVIESLFQSALTIAFTGIELAFYSVVLSFAASKNLNPWIFVLLILAATVMLITGSEKTAMFFGVDTGAQKGWRAMAQTAFMGAQIGRGAKSIANAVTKTPKKVAGAAKGLAQAPMKLASAGTDAKLKAQDFKNDLQEGWDNIKDNKARAAAGVGSVAAEEERNRRQEQRENLNPAKVKANTGNNGSGHEPEEKQPSGPVSNNGGGNNGPVVPGGVSNGTDADTTENGGKSVAKDPQKVNGQPENIHAQGADSTVKKPGTPSTNVDGKSVSKDPSKTNRQTKPSPATSNSNGNPAQDTTKTVSEAKQTAGTTSSTATTQNVVSEGGSTKESTPMQTISEVQAGTTSNTETVRTENTATQKSYGIGSEKAAPQQTHITKPNTTSSTRIDKTGTRSTSTRITNNSVNKPSPRSGVKSSSSKSTTNLDNNLRNRKRPNKRKPGSNIDRLDRRGE